MEFLLEMDEFLENSLFELKRADFLIFVSLKYSAVVEIMRNGISRLVDAMEHVINGYLNDLEKSNKIIEIPNNNIAKVKLLEESNQDLKSHLEFYGFLKSLLKANYKKEGEFRKKLTMISTIRSSDKEEIVHVNIEALKNYYKQTQEFIDTYKQIKSDEE